MGEVGGVALDGEGQQLKLLGECGGILAVEAVHQGDDALQGGCTQHRPPGTKPRGVECRTGKAAKANKQGAVRTVGRSLTTMRSSAEINQRGGKPIPAEVFCGDARPKGSIIGFGSSRKLFTKTKIPFLGGGYQFGHFHSGEIEAPQCVALDVKVWLWMAEQLSKDMKTFAGGIVLLSAG